MAQYRCKHLEAFQLPEDEEEGLDSFIEWAKQVGFTNYETSKYNPGFVIILNLEDDLKNDYAAPGDFIVKNSSGGFTKSPGYIFLGSYEKVPNN